MSSLLGMKRCHGTLCKQKCGSVAQLYGRHGCGKHCYWHCASCVCYGAWPSTSVVTLVESTACTTRGWPWVKGSQQPCRKDTGLRHARRTSTAMVRPRVRVAYVAAMATHQCVLVLGRPVIREGCTNAGNTQVDALWDTRGCVKPSPGVSQACSTRCGNAGLIWHRQNGLSSPLHVQVPDSLPGCCHTAARGMVWFLAV